MNGCLECMACETACPSGVQYRHVIHSFKNDQARTRGPAPMLGWIQRAMLFGLTPYRSRMAWALFPVKLMQRLGLGWAVRLSGYLMPGFLRRMQEIVPDLAPYHNLPEFLPAIGPKRATVGLLLGCASDAFHPQINLATARVLQHNGCDVHIPRAQACCGALHKHAGLDDEAAKLAAGNCDAFASVPGGLAGLDAIISNAGGCSPVLKDYGHILEDHNAAGPGKVFGKKVRDIHEFLADLGPVKPRHRVPLKATYHDACHSLRELGIKDGPRRLLSKVQGLELREMDIAEECCGFGGTFCVKYPAISNAIVGEKADAIRHHSVRPWLHHRVDARHHDAESCPFPVAVQFSSRHSRHPRATHETIHEPTEIGRKPRASYMAGTARENTMSHFITSAMGFTTGVFAWVGDPLMTFLVAMCLVVWIAITSVKAPAWARTQPRTITPLRPE